MSNQNQIPPGLAYLLLKNSLKLFDNPWHSLTPEEQTFARQEAEEEYRLQRLVLKSKEAATIFIAPTIPTEAVNLIRQRFPDEESFGRELKAHHLSEQTLLAAVADELRVEGALNLAGQRAGAPSPDEVAAFYLANPEKFHSPERRRAQHILITINDDFPDNTYQQAQLRIEKIKQELTAFPDRFEQLVQRYSECPSALRNGDLGEIEKNKSFPTLGETLFALNQGEISEIIESHLGLHIIRCLSITPASTLSLEEAAPIITKLLTQKRSRQAQREWLVQLDDRKTQ